MQLIKQPLPDTVAQCSSRRQTAGRGERTARNGKPMWRVADDTVGGARVRRTDRTQPPVPEGLAARRESSHATVGQRG